jgi:hypothetical protein
MCTVDRLSNSSHHEEPELELTLDDAQRKAMLETI